VERCAEEMGITSSLVELKVEVDGQSFKLDPRDWEQLKSNDRISAEKRSKGKEPIRGSSSSGESLDVG